MAPEASITHIGAYTVEKILAHGDDAEVYAVRAGADDAPAAIKMLSAEASTDDARRTSFAESAEALRAYWEQFADGDSAPGNWVRVLGAGEHAGDDVARPYLVMEMMAGSLEARISESAEPWPADEALDFAKQIACGLEERSAGPIKSPSVICPGDILFDADGVAYLSHGELACAQAGAVRYAPPESGYGKVATNGALYSFAVVLHQLLTGTEPVEGRVPRRIEDYFLDLPFGLEAVITQNLDPEPGARMQSAGELISALERVGERPAALDDFDDFAPPDFEPQESERAAQPEDSDLHEEKAGQAHDDSGGEAGVEVPSVPLRERIARIPTWAYAAAALAVVLIFGGVGVVRVTGDKLARDRSVREQKATVLIAQAEAYYKQGRFLHPPGENALESYLAAAALIGREGSTIAKGLARIRDYHMDLARKALAAEDLDAALGYVEEALLADPKDKDARALADRIRAMGEPSDAEIADSVGTSFGKSVTTEFAEANGGEPGDRASVSEGPIDPELELHRLRTAAQSESSDLATHMALGASLVRRGELGSALEAYKRAIVLEPRSAEAWLAYADVLADSGRRDDAVRGYRTALEKGADTTRVHQSIARVLRRAGDIDGAIAAYRTAGRAQKRSVSGRLDLGWMFLGMGDAGAAIEEFEAALAAEPTNPRALQGLAAARGEIPDPLR